MTAPAPTELAAHWRGLLVRYWFLIGAALLVCLLLYVFWQGLAQMVGAWASPNYSYAYAVPFISAWIFLQRYERLSEAGVRQSWIGVAVLCAGLVLAQIGDLSTTFSIIQYAFLVTLAGLVLTAVGWKGTRLLLPALVYLAFMVPVPVFFQVELTSSLQHLSTQIGVAALRAFAVPVFVEGNVIDLGIYRLQVAEACSGLRYLYPLMSFGFLVAYFYRAPFWQRAVLFVSTIPITILMNGLRIGAIGLAVDRSGIEAAQGFLHLFEGWVVFVLCLAILLLEAVAFAHFCRPRRTLLAALDIELPRFKSLKLPKPATASALRSPFSAAVLLVALVGLMVAVMPNRVETMPSRAPLALFPTRIGAWHGVASALDPDSLSALKLDDYANIDYVDAAGAPSVNVYIAYYQSQLKGAAIHSPHNCLPAGGWDVKSIKVVPLNIRASNGQVLRVNRVVISKGLDTRLLYYWFQERGRIITQEYAGKWYVFLDSILKHRTDGAMVRLSTPIGPSVTQAELRLAAFTADVEKRLPEYIPD